MVSEINMVPALIEYTVQQTEQPLVEDSEFQSMQLYSSQRNYSHSSIPWSKVVMLKIVYMGISSANNGIEICHAGRMKQNSFI